MKNYVASLNNFGITYTGIDPIKSGEIFLFGSLALISSNDASAGDRVVAVSAGIFNFKIANAFAGGQILYYHADSKQIDVLSTGGTSIGWALDSGTNQISRVAFNSFIKSEKGA